MTPKLTQAEHSLVIFFVLAVVAAASVGTYVFVPRFCPKDTQLFVAPQLPISGTYLRLSSLRFCLLLSPSLAADDGP